MNRNESLAVALMLLLLGPAAYSEANSTTEELISKAIAYGWGIAVKRDTDRAHRLFLEAAETRDPLARGWSALLIYQGYWGYQKDKQQGVSEAQRLLPKIRRQAQRGEVEEQFLLAMYYNHGCGVEIDDAEAVKWFSRAAKQGHTTAMNFLGVRYRRGRGVGRDYAEAVRWWRPAAEKGSYLASYNLARAYALGHGVSKDCSQAARWYRRAAQLGHTGSMSNLGLLYYNGEGVPRDISRAMTWWRKAADAGQAVAMFNLGMAHTTGEGLGKKDLESAIRWYRRAAEQNDPDSMLSLGEFYYFGRGVKKDYGQAVIWFHRAAQVGDESAMFNLGVCYRLGRGAARNRYEALFWYKSAASKGHIQAAKDYDLLSGYTGKRSVICDVLLPMARVVRNGFRWYRVYGDLKLGYKVVSGRTTPLAAVVSVTVDRAGGSVLDYVVRELELKCGCGNIDKVHRPEKTVFHTCQKCGAESRHTINVHND